jgi:hypothetical protein
MGTYQPFLLGYRLDFGARVPHSPTWKTYHLQRQRHRVTAQFEEEPNFDQGGCRVQVRG